MDRKNGMRKSAFDVACLALLFPFCIGEAQAANWIMLLGTEPTQAPAIRTFGLIGIDYQRTSDSPVAAGPWTGSPLARNQIGPELENAEELQASLVRLGVRGRLAEGRFNYWLSPFAGSNPISKNGPQNVKFTDVSATFSLVPHARIRMGQFKQPGSEEGLQPARLRNYVNLSFIGSQIVLERFFDSDGVPTDDANELDAPAGGFRDTGVQIFDAIRSGRWEHTYAVMAGTGSGLAIYNGSGSDRPEWYLYWSSELVFGGKGPLRQGLKLSSWFQNGDREIRTGILQSEETVDRTRYGVAATFLRGPWRAAGEWIAADGMIFNGTDGAAVPGTISVNPPLGITASFNVLSDEKADGWYLDLGFTLLNQLEVNARYDRLNRGTRDALNERRFKTMTLGASYRFNANYRLLLNYQFRDAEAPRLPGSAAANRILDDVDDLFSVRFLASF